MKRSFLTFFIIFVVLSSLSSLSFHPFSIEPLYQEGIANPYSMTSFFGMHAALGDKHRQNQVYSIITETKSNKTKHTFYDYLPYSEESQDPKNNKTLLMKGGVSLGLARLRFEKTKITPAMDLELNLGGYISTVMNQFSKNDSLSYDGIYFLGGSAQIADRVTLRFGLHHFSGHYGDELLEKLYDYHNVDFSKNALLPKYGDNPTSTYTLNGLVEYVRDNSYLASISANLPSNIRIYGGVEMPMNPSWIRPFVHVPADYENKVNESGRPTLIDRIGGDAIDGEGFSQEQLDEEQELKRKANGSYKALRVYSGIEWRYPFSLGNLFLAGDLQFHQDGQTLHTVGGYDPSNPWEIELTLAGGVEFPSSENSKYALRLYALYHNGRAPSIQFFYQRMKSVTIGIGIG